MKTYTGKHIALAFLLGVFCVVASYRWYQLEKSTYTTEIRLSYIEGFLEQSTRGER